MEKRFLALLHRFPLSRWLPQDSTCNWSNVCELRMARKRYRWSIRYYGWHNESSHDHSGLDDGKIWPLFSDLCNRGSAAKQECRSSLSWRTFRVSNAKATRLRRSIFEVSIWLGIYYIADVCRKWSFRWVRFELIFCARRRTSQINHYKYRRRKRAICCLQNRLQ